MRRCPTVSERAASWLLALLLMALPGAAAERFRDWTLLPLSAGPCLLHHRAVAAAEGLTLADVFLRPEETGLLISVRVPLGASLADGPAYRHPGAARAVPLVWQSCNSETCLAQVRVDAAERGRLERGAWIELGFVPVPGARPLVFAVSLAGVTLGLETAGRCPTAPDG